MTVARGSACSLARVLLCTTAVISLFQTSLYAYAQESVSESEEDLTVVVTASRTEESVASIPGAVQVIGKKELNKALQGSSDISTALSRLVPGFSLDNQTLSGGGQSFRGRSVQILVNGAPRTTSLRRLSRALSLIDPDSIERIEVVNGASAIYGDGGTGGVINIITKTAESEGWSGDISTTVSASERDVSDSLNVTTSLGAGFKKDGASIQLNGQFKNTGDMFDGNGSRIPEDPLTGQGGGSGIEQYDLSGQFVFEGDAFDLSVYANIVKMEQDIKYNTDYTSDPVSIDYSSEYLGLSPMEDSANLSMTLNFYDLGAVGDAKLELYYNNAEKRAAYVPISAANIIEYDTVANESQTVLFAEQAGARLTIDTDLSTLYEGLQLTWGSDYSFDDISQSLPDGQDIIAPMTQHGIASFAQIKAPIGELFEVRAGVRNQLYFLDIDSFVRPGGTLLYNGVEYPLGEHTFTKAQKFYSAHVFNIGGVMHVNEATQVFAGFSQGFSVPDVGGFTRRALPANFTVDDVIDVSAIAPEAAITNSFEVGSRYTTSNLSISASAFYSTSDKGVNFDDATQEILQAEERIWGAELNVSGKITPVWGAGVVLAYAEGVWDQDGDGKLDEDLPNNRIQSPFKATLFSDYDFKNGFSVQGEAVIGSGRSGKKGTTSSGTAYDLTKLEPSVTINASGTYASQYGDFQFGVSNLFDTDQDNVTATALRDRVVLAEGRRFFLTYSKSF
ncbi:Ferric aerobactin receptor precursor [Pseudovibrio axinellae]|uniref:Ferric aerobactin receptor n=1 Tax=Pseudovibrio axinellae TaxID=989403 RepID=A0A161V8D0_9HYPH|nr:TonB-dependent receptor [Pseudovibrio axinellae]KZL15438.1 Ferric aerobactin receptor precursor [Pseudovibrio axinellae]SER56457.1 iron complex outermembrane recepter protein [Pseudovibrio axinellae]